MRSTIAALLFTALLGGCGSERGTGPGELPADLHILFIGNSLTEYNDLPRMVADLIEAGTDARVHYQRAEGWGSLEDHWARQSTISAIWSRQWDYVVLQQGPSSLPESREHLIEYATKFAGVIREAGGQPALYMVWPERARLFALSAVAESYRAAAEAVDGLLIPAGDAWREAWVEDPDLPLYGPDDFHPSPMGSYLAALTFYQHITGRSPVGLPLVAGSGGIQPAVLSALQAAAARTATTQAAQQR